MSENKAKQEPSGNVAVKKFIWLAAIIIVYFIISNLSTSEALSKEALKAIALMVMAVMAWICQIVPIAIASLVFVFLQPVVGTVGMGPAVQTFVTPTVLFVVASFFLAIALSASGLGGRLSLSMSAASKGDSRRLVLLLMLATAGVSTVISDVPAAACFFPIGLAIIEKNNLVFGKSNLAKALMIGIPFASLIGGIATPAGSSMNVMTIGLLESTAGITISFTQWTIIGLPTAIVMTILSWWCLLLVFKPEVKTLAGVDEIRQQLDDLGPMKASEKKYITIFVVLLIVWLTESIHKIPLQATTTFGAALFFLPGIDLLNWNDSKNKIGWDIILMIGAANSLGTALSTTGAAKWLSDAVLSGIAGAPTIVVLGVVVLFTIVIHLLVPVNPAIVSIMVPTLAAFAATNGMSATLLVLPMGMAVSCALLLPLDPVPLITFSSGQYTMVDYFKGGWLVSIVWLIISVAIMLLLGGVAGLL
jgi:sodium-dependent dicarboxylate transporter 2/3/5